MPVVPKQPWHLHFSAASPEAVKLLRSFLAYNPLQRLSAAKVSNRHFVLNQTPNSFPSLFTSFRIPRRPSDFIFLFLIQSSLDHFRRFSIVSSYAPSLSFFSPGFGSSVFPHCSLSDPSIPPAQATARSQSRSHHGSRTRWADQTGSERCSSEPYRCQCQGRDETQGGRRGRGR